MRRRLPAVQGASGLRLLLTLVLTTLAACAGRRAPVHPELQSVAQQGDALALADALEAQIAAGTDTPGDREFAYEQVSAHEEDTAAYCFARAVVAGRLAQQRGLLAVGFIAEAERYARRSRELDPNFRDGAATRLLGTLYVFVPATLLEHGDSEVGLDLLEELATQRPDVVENHLRLAEAYIMLGDPIPALPHLCYCLAHKTALRRDEQALLDRLCGDVKPLKCKSAE